MKWKFELNRAWWRRRRRHLKHEKPGPTISQKLALGQYEAVLPVDQIDGVPFGLELLINTDNLFIMRSVVVDDHVVGVDIKHHYDIIDVNKGRLYFAWESTTTELGKQRNFDIKIVDFEGRPILEFKKSSSCVGFFLKMFGCCGASGSSIYLNQPNGSKIGSIIQTFNGWTPEFIYENEFEKPQIIIQGPQGGGCCFNCNMQSSLLIDVEFSILTLDGEKIGSITRSCLDPMKKIDTYSATFPVELPVDQKAALIAAIFAFNVMYFGQSEKDAIELYEEQREEAHEHDRINRHRRDLEALGLTESGELMSEVGKPPTTVPATRGRQTSISFAN